jgi:hypothetical protein
MQITDLTNINWERNLTSYSSGGAYFKASPSNSGRRTYLKLSNYDDERGFIGFESVYEYLASKLGLYLGIEVLDCELLKATILHNGREYTTFVQQTEDFLPRGRSKTAFENYYIHEHLSGETRLEFLNRLGFSRRVSQMFLFDYIIYNRDRHCNNLEFIKNGDIELAPLFDNGVSFFAPYAGRYSEIEKFDLLSNNITNNDFGTRYLEDNLAYVTADDLSLAQIDENSLHQQLFSIFDNDDGFPDWHRNRCMDLILKRYAHACELLHNR